MHFFFFYFVFCKQFRSNFVCQFVGIETQATAAPAIMINCRAVATNLCQWRLMSGGWPVRSIQVQSSPSPVPCHTNWPAIYLHTSVRNAVAAAHSMNSSVYIEEWPSHSRRSRRNAEILLSATFRFIVKLQLINLAIRRLEIVKLQSRRCCCCCCCCWVVAATDSTNLIPGQFTFSNEKKLQQLLNLRGDLIVLQ